MTIGGDCLTLHAWQIGRIAFRATIVGNSIPIRQRPRDFAAARISPSSVEREGCAAGQVHHTPVGKVGLSYFFG
jgi:hypothetical protein